MTHLSMERLAEYRAGELTASEAEAIQDHLAICRECADALLDLARFGALMESEEPLPPGPGVPTPEQTAASWRALRDHLTPEPARSARRFRRTTAAPVLRYALAAGLGACLVGFPLWIAFRGRPEPSSAPLAMSLPGEAEVLRGEGGAGKPIVVEPSAGATLLALPLPEVPEFPAYRVEIRTLGGEVRLAADALLTAVAAPPASRPATPAARPLPRLLTVAVPPVLLPTGEYRLRIFGVRDGHAEALAEHPLRVLGP
jgi:hypothetical protein